MDHACAEGMQMWLVLTRTAPEVPVHVNMESATYM